MTKIRRVRVTQYYLKFTKRDPRTSEEKVAYKRRYVRYVFVLSFPKTFDVEDLVNREMDFRRNGDEIVIRPAPT